MNVKIVQINKGRNCRDVLLVNSLGDTLNMEDHMALATYGADAQLIFDFLMTSIPGGTYDRLCVMLQRYWRKTSLEYGDSFSCEACGWKGSFGIKTEEGWFCPECESSATHNQKD